MILPEAVNVLADITLILDNVPPLPEVTKLPTVALPVTVKLPNVPTLVTCDWLALTLNVVPVNVNPVPA